MDDLQALRALAADGPRAQRETAAAHFYFQWGKRLKSHFALHGAPGPQAEDVLQEAIEKLVTKADTFRGDTPDSAAAWVWTVARNALDDYRDRHTRHTRGHVPLEDGMPEGRSDDPVLSDSVRGNPAYQYQLDQARACVRRQLRRFMFERARDVEALWLVTQGYTIAEVAGKLGKTPNATAVYLTGCRDRIRPWLATCRRYLDGLSP